MEGGEKSKRCRNEESWIMDGMMSMLPDELLVIILSHLTLKEAAATSILSRRWRYLWTFTEKLDLDGTNSSKLGEDTSKYVKWVNHVIASRKNSAPVNDFRVLFNLNIYNEEHIHEWIRYALERKVQTLELNFNREGYEHDELCSIPFRVLKETCNSIYFKQLRRVSLEAVNVCGEALEFLLRNCPLLEGLSVCESRELVTLKVIRPFPSFKLLEIRLCNRLESVEIRDANLVSLKFSSSWRYVWFVVKNSPSLVELSIALRFQFLDCFLLHFWSILDQLEILNVEMNAPDDFRLINPNLIKLRHMNLIKLRHLKQLVLTYLPTRRNYSPPSLTNIIRAAPQLEKFELKTQEWQLCWVRRIEEEEKKNLYGKTKELRVVGYGGTVFEVEFVKNLVEKAVALQRVTIHRNLMNGTKIEARAWLKAHARRLLANQLSHPIIIEIL